MKEKTFEELTFEEFLVKFTVASKACGDFYEAINEMDEKTKMSAICLLFDMLYGEKAPEKAILCACKVSNVVSKFGAYHKE